jgi:hypothetical protein
VDMSPGYPRRPGGRGTAGKGLVARYGPEQFVEESLERWERFVRDVLAGDLQRSHAAAESHRLHERQRHLQGAGAPAPPDVARPSTDCPRKSARLEGQVPVGVCAQSLPLGLCDRAANSWLSIGDAPTGEVVGREF